jgi:hypothetical protein
MTPTPYPIGSVFELTPAQGSVYDICELRGYLDCGEWLEASLASLVDFAPLISCSVDMLTAQQPSGAAYVFSAAASRELEETRAAAATKIADELAGGWPAAPWQRLECDA